MIWADGRTGNRIDVKEEEETVLVDDAKSEDARIMHN